MKAADPDSAGPSRDQAVPALSARELDAQIEALRAVLDAVPEIVWYKDTDNNILWANRAACEHSGVTLDYVVGRSCYDLSPREAAEYHETDREVARRRQPVLGVVQHLREITGRRRAILTDKYPHFDAAGNVVGVIAISRDVTLQRRAEEALLASERRYQILSEVSPVGVAHMDARGSAHSVNERWREIIGLSTERCLGTGWLDALDQADRALLERDWRGAVERGADSFRARFRVRDPATAVRHVAFQAVAECDSAGTVSGYLATLADVSSADAAEEALREQRSFFDTLASMAPVGIFHSDVAGRCSYVNDRWCEIWGLAPEAAMELRWMRALHPEDREWVLAAFQTAVGAKRRYRGEFRVRHADGTVRWVLALGVPRLGEHGEVLSLVGVSADITERKEAEDHVRRMNDELERRVAERTAELQAANQELEAFCYCVSHDLRTPLRTLDGFSFTLLEDYGPRLDGPAVESLQRIRRASQRMGHLIDDLLTMARLNRGELRREPVDLYEIAALVVEELRLSIPERAIDVQIERGLNAEGDPSLLRLVLQNLIENAWKFTTPRPLGHIEVGRDPGPSADAPVFFVRDDGVGFDMAYSDKLFRAFQRLHLPGEFEGSGIGLATVDRIVKRHGGQVWAQSRPGHGATFYFTLPAVSAGEAPSSESSSESSNESSSEPSSESLA